MVYDSGTDFFPWLSFHDDVFDTVDTVDYSETWKTLEKAGFLGSSNQFVLYDGVSSRHSMNFDEFVTVYWPLKDQYYISSLKALHLDGFMNILLDLSGMERLTMQNEVWRCTDSDLSASYSSICGPSTLTVIDNKAKELVILQANSEKKPFFEI